MEGPVCSSHGTTARGVVPAALAGTPAVRWAAPTPTGLRWPCFPVVRRRGHSRLGGWGPGHGRAGPWPPELPPRSFGACGPNSVPGPAHEGLRLLLGTPHAVLPQTAGPSRGPSAPASVRGQPRCDPCPGPDPDEPTRIRETDGCAVCRRLCVRTCGRTCICVCVCSRTCLAVCPPRLPVRRVDLRFYCTCACVCVCAPMRARICTFACVSFSVSTCATALCVPACVSVCLCARLCMCACLFVRVCGHVLWERRRWVEFGPETCLVWPSQYFQHLEPTFKNQDISHKNSAFQFLLKIQKPWQPQACVPMRPLSPGAARRPPRPPTLHSLAHQHLEDESL